MTHDPAQLGRLISELNSIRLSAFLMEREFESDLAKATSTHRDSARNLLHYMALRRRDLRDLQLELASLGLSSLGRAESHVLGTVDPVLGVLHNLSHKEFQLDDGLEPVSFVDGRAKLSTNAEALFPRGSTHDGRRRPIRIMVTMPAAAADDYPLVRDLIANGMCCMRINCAHDDESVWTAIIDHLDRAKKETDSHCSLLMDLGGPKIRTGAVEAGPRVLYWEPHRDVLGNVTAAATLWLSPAEAPDPSPIKGAKTVPLSRKILERLEPGDRIVFRDLRQHPREIEVQSQSGRSWIATGHQNTYLGAQTALSVKRRDGSKARHIPAIFFANTILPMQQALSLVEGDVFTLTGKNDPAKIVARDAASGKLLSEPSIACTAPGVFESLKPGERVLFDDGKIGAVILSSSKDEVRLRVTHPIEQPKKLRADKGINFPDSELDFPAVTEKDLIDLDFVASRADMVGLSFVNYPSDIEQLQREIASRTSRNIGLILKIETQCAFRHLAKLLLTSLRSRRVGVMIARGDLAVECGYERLAEVQEEILWVCEAAHVPVIWATQVLDRLSKKGVPTRAEVTDAAMGERAECVMLNKGPHIVESVRLLSDIVGRMQGHHDKKTPRLRALSISEHFDGERKKRESGHGK